MRCAGCLKLGLITLGTVTILSSGCARVASDHAACPPVVEYPTAFQKRAAAEVEALPNNTAVETCWPITTSCGGGHGRAGEGRAGHGPHGKN